MAAVKRASTSGQCAINHQGLTRSRSNGENAVLEKPSVGAAYPNGRGGDAFHLRLSSVSELIMGNLKHPTVAPETPV